MYINTTIYVHTRNSTYAVVFAVWDSSRINSSAASAVNWRQSLEKEHKRKAIHSITPKKIATEKDKYNTDHYSNSITNIHRTEISMYSKNIYI